MHQSALRSGTSVWQAQDDVAIACPPLDGEIRCDVAVIGSGATGALVSHLLIKAGVDTVLVDQGAVGAGSTASSTGLLLYEIDTPLVLGTASPVCFDQTGSRIFVGGGDGAVHLWDSPLATEILTLRPNSNDVMNVIVSPDNTCIAAKSWNGVVRLWRASSAKKQEATYCVF